MENYFSDATPQTDTSAQDAPPADNAPGDENEPSVILPKESLGGKKYAVGDTVTLRIVSDNEDSYEATCEDNATEEKGEPETPAPKGNSKMASMMG